MLTTVGLERKKDEKYIAYYGGGFSSKAMIVHIIKNNLPIDYVVFFDSDNEIPETIEDLKIMKEYLRNEKIPYKVLKIRNSLSKIGFKEKALAKRMLEWHKGMKKTKTLREFYGELNSKIYQYIGISYDEIYEMRSGNMFLYPLIDSKIGIDECKILIKTAKLPIGFSSKTKNNCIRSLICTEKYQ